MRRASAASLVHVASKATLPLDSTVFTFIRPACSNARTSSALLALPGLWIAYRYFTGTIGGNALKALVRETGLWGIRFIVLTLAEDSGELFEVITKCRHGVLNEACACCGVSAPGAT